MGIVTKPANRTKTYPGSARIGAQPERKLTPVPAVRDTFAVFCKGTSG